MKMNNQEAEDQKVRIRKLNDINKPPPVDRLPQVTTLLRACRDGNEILIKAALRDVIINGISKEQLNLTDKSGRVSHCISFERSFLALRCW